MWAGDGALLGARYLVTMHDCCVGGRFTAVLTEWDGSSMKFDNGVHLDRLDGVTLEEVR